jgi:hypothetical protein
MIAKPSLTQRGIHRSTGKRQSVYPTEITQRDELLSRIAGYFWKSYLAQLAKQHKRRFSKTGKG